MGTNQTRTPFAQASILAAAEQGMSEKLGYYLGTANVGRTLGGSADGAILLAAAPLATVGATTNVGVVYVFVGGVWDQTVKPPTTIANIYVSKDILVSLLT